jgi:hypothetical protein
MMRLRLAALLVLLPALCAAQGTRVDRAIVSKYELDSASYIYCKLGPSTVGPGRVETSGSSATVTGVALLTDPFTNVAVGDEMMFGAGGAAVRVVTAWASATSITVDSVINLDVDGGMNFSYTHPTCGTAATDGWFVVGPGVHTIHVVYRQGDLTGGVDFSVETRTRGVLGVPEQVAAGTVAATTALVNQATIVLGETSNEFRVGLKYGSADTSDATTNAEMIDVVLSTEH